MNHYSISEVSDELVLSNLKSKCKNCYNNCETIGKIIDCPIYNEKRRNGIIVNTKNKTFLCCNKTKTTKLFREKLESLSYSYSDIKLVKSDFENSIKTIEQKRINRLIHNLTSINAHNIQEIYDLVSQDILTKNINEQLEYIENEIISNPREASMMFIRMAKHNIHMKSEFSIYKKLDRANPTFDKRSHPIHKVLMNVLHTFFVDFSDKNVFVNVGDNQNFILCDYEAIQVALYHIVENSAKYVQPNSKIDISFRELADKIELKFKMISFYIEPEELEKIFTEGYSGKEVKKARKNGEGIGLWRVSQMLQLNDASIKINAGTDIEKLMGFRFSDNEIILEFKKY
jgi:light-regulated signal transduction histidine kinase (bacteriophytochrome)